MIGTALDAAPLPAEVYVLWEELLALPGPRFTPRRFAGRQRWHRYRAALDLFHTNTAAVQTLWDLWEQDQQVTVVTYLPRHVAARLPDRLEADNVPHHRLLVDTPLHMSRTIALQDDVARIFHGIADHRLLYGPKGVFVPPHSPALMREVL